MSSPRANVFWQSFDGTWNHGFYAVSEPDPDDEDDLDAEEDYDYDSFEWVTTGHPTEQSAEDLVSGMWPNPDGSERCTLDDTSKEVIAKLDAAAAACTWRKPYTPDSQ